MHEYQNKWIGLTHRLYIALWCFRWQIAMMLAKWVELSSDANVAPVWALRFWWLGMRSDDMVAAILQWDCSLKGMVLGKTVH